MKKISLAIIALLIVFQLSAIVAVPDSVIVAYLNANSHKDTIWDKNFNSLITALISIIAIAYGYFYNRKLLRLQLRTVEKEWIETMRKILAEVLYVGTQLDVERNRNENSALIPTYVEKLQELAYSIQVNLTSVKNERKFHDAISSFIRMSINKDIALQSSQHYNHMYDRVLTSFTEMIEDKLKL